MHLITQALVGGGRGRLSDRQDQFEVWIRRMLYQLTTQGAIELERDGQVLQRKGTIVGVAELWV